MSLASGFARLQRRWIRARLEREHNEQLRAVLRGIYPDRWQDDTGKLRAAVMVFLLGAELDADEFSLVVAYARRWVETPLWVGVDRLRSKLYLAETTRQLHGWVREASEFGIEPF